MPISWVHTSQPPLTPPYFLPFSLLTPSVHRNNVHVKTIIPTLCHTHANSLCLPPKGLWQQSNFLLMWMLYLSLSTPPSLSLSFTVSHGSSSPADIWSHKRYICCYSHWHLLASGHQLCQCWLFLLGGGGNVTGTGAAQTDGRQLHALGSLCVEIITKPVGSSGSTLGFSQRVAIFTSHIHSPRPSTWGLVTAKNSLSHNLMTPSITALCCVSSPGRLCLVAAVCLE